LLAAKKKPRLLLPLLSPLLLLRLPPLTLLLHRPLPLLTHLPLRLLPPPLPSNSGQFAMKATFGWLFSWRRDA
jgi:hypothetical protein